MNRRKKLAGSLAAAMLAGLLVYGVYELQLRQIRLQESVDVVAARHFVPAGTVLEREHLKLVALPRSAVISGMMTSLEAAVGTENAIPLGTDEPLLQWKVARYPFLPKGGQSTFQVPKTYIKSISSGIRAGDEVFVYVSSEAASDKLFAEPVMVASVKTAANLEIDNPKQSNLLAMASSDQEGMYLSRREANGTIDAINLNLTELQWMALDEACRQGAAKLVIAYHASALAVVDKEGH